jgi:very-short-patch-repair endonuclease
MARRRTPVATAPATPALVAVVTRPKDLELARTEGWYRIPVDKAPGALDHARYLAFYQTRNFGAERWAVNHCARIHGITRARRVELLPDEAGHRRDNVEYYRVALGPLEPLPRPIPSRAWRRILFIPTTLELLRTAREVNDLFRVSPIEDRLYGELRASGVEPERQFVVRESGENYRLDMAIFCADGRLDIECDGEAYHAGRDKARADRHRDTALATGRWYVLRFSGPEILEDPAACCRVIRRAMRRLGGAKRRRAAGRFSGR